MTWITACSQWASTWARLLHTRFFFQSGAVPMSAASRRQQSSDMFRKKKAALIGRPPEPRGGVSVYDTTRHLSHRFQCTCPLDTQSSQICTPAPTVIYDSRSLSAIKKHSNMHTPQRISHSCIFVFCFCIFGRMRPSRFFFVKCVAGLATKCLVEEKFWSRKSGFKWTKNDGDTPP